MIIFSDYNEVFTTDVKSNIDFKDKVEFLHHAKTHGIFLPLKSNLRIYIYTSYTFYNTFSIIHFLPIYNSV